MSKIKHILSVIHYTICGAVHFQFTHFSCDDGENIYTLSYYHHQIGNINYYPLFKVRSWNNCVRCMSFYILMFAWHLSIPEEKQHHLTMIIQMFAFMSCLGVHGKRWHNIVFMTTVPLSQYAAWCILALFLSGRSHAWPNAKCSWSNERCFTCSSVVMGNALAIQVQILLYIYIYIRWSPLNIYQIWYINIHKFGDHRVCPERLCH